MGAHYLTLYDYWEGKVSMCVLNAVCNTLHNMSTSQRFKSVHLLFKNIGANKLVFKQFFIFRKGDNT